MKAAPTIVTAKILPQTQKPFPLKNSTAAFLASCVVLNSSAIAAKDSASLVPVSTSQATSKETLSTLGISIWTFTIDVEGGRSSRADIYAKHKSRPPILLINGPIIRNDDNAKRISRRIVVTIDGLETEPWQKKLKIGIGAFDKTFCWSKDTAIVRNPIPRKAKFLMSGDNLVMDGRKRIMLVNGNDEIFSALPYVDGNEYAIYIQISPWTP